MEFNKKYNEIIEEAGGRSYRPVMSDYIYFLDDQELYLNRPSYKRLGGPEELSKALVSAWKKVRVAVGEDIHDIVPGNDIDLGTQSDKWFVVDETFPRDHSFPALLSIK